MFRVLGHPSLTDYSDALSRMSSASDLTAISTCGIPSLCELQSKLLKEGCRRDDIRE